MTRGCGVAGHGKLGMRTRKGEPMRMERLIGIMCVLADAQRTTIGALAERFRCV